jgi:hypothetical protein
MEVFGKQINAGGECFGPKANMYEGTSREILSSHNMQIVNRIPMLTSTSLNAIPESLSLSVASSSISRGPIDPSHQIEKERRGLTPVSFCGLRLEKNELLHLSCTHFSAAAVELMHPLPLSTRCTIIVAT